MIAVRPKKFKSCLTSGIPSGESFFMTYPPAQLYVYQNIYFSFQTRKNKTYTQKQKAKETKENRKKKKSKEEKNQ